MVSKRLYIEIADLILKDIYLSDLKPGSKLKSVREFAIEYKVNAKTVQRAFDYLDTFNIFYTEVGEGRFLEHDENVHNVIRHKLIYVEAENFIQKMKEYNITLEEMIEIVKENYE